MPGAALRKAQKPRRPLLRLPKQQKTCLLLLQRKPPLKAWRLPRNPSPSSPITENASLWSWECPVIDPQRIAILDMASLDILDALGLGDRVVGSASTTIDYLLDYVPSDENGIANLGTIKNADLVEVAACEPDVIFIGGRSSQRLQRSGSHCACRLSLHGFRTWCRSEHCGQCQNDCLPLWKGSGD